MFYTAAAIYTVTLVHVASFLPEFFSEDKETHCLACVTNLLTTDSPLALQSYTFRTVEDVHATS